jgi:hypothetical protein
MAFTVQSVTNPVYINAEGTGIDCQVKWEEFKDAQPFCAASWDTEAHGIALYNDLIAGKYGPIAPYVYVPPVSIPAKNQPTTTGTQAA